jgi:hypothetical protein
MISELMVGARRLELDLADRKIGYRRELAAMRKVEKLETALVEARARVAVLARTPAT